MHKQLENEHFEKRLLTTVIQSTGDSNSAQHRSRDAPRQLSEPPWGSLGARAGQRGIHSKGQNQGAIGSRVPFLKCMKLTSGEPDKQGCPSQGHRGSTVAELDQRRQASKELNARGGTVRSMNRTSKGQVGGVAGIDTEGHQLDKNQPEARTWVPRVAPGCGVQGLLTPVWGQVLRRGRWGEKAAQKPPLRTPNIRTGTARAASCVTPCWDRGPKLW